MARPFGQSDNSEKQQEKDNVQSANSAKETNLPSASLETSENSSECRGKNPTSDQSAAVITNVYYVSNSNHLNCGPTFISVVNKESKISNNLPNSDKEKCETDRKIKVRKGVLTSNRSITSEEIQIVAKHVKNDWKNLLKKLPGVTADNLHFHQSFINTMDRRESTNMAEIALYTWKTELPEFSTIGNLSRVLFSIGHPDLVACLRP